MIEPRVVATIGSPNTIGTRITPTHANPAPEEPEDTPVDEEQMQAKVVSGRRRRTPRTTEDAETK